MTTYKRLLAAFILAITATASFAGKAVYQDRDDPCLVAIFNDEENLIHITRKKCAGPQEYMDKILDKDGPTFLDYGSPIEEVRDYNSFSWKISTNEALKQGDGFALTGMEDPDAIVIVDKEFFINANTFLIIFPDMAYDIAVSDGQTWFSISLLGSTRQVVSN